MTGAGFDDYGTLAKRGEKRCDYATAGATDIVCDLIPHSKDIRHRDLHGRRWSWDDMDVQVERQSPSETFTRKDMARAWEDGCSAGWVDSVASMDATRAGKPEPGGTKNPYE